MTTLIETSQNHATAPIKARVWDCWLSNDWQLVKMTGLICYQSFSKLLPGISFSSTYCKCVYKRQALQKIYTVYMYVCVCVCVCACVRVHA